MDYELTIPKHIDKKLIKLGKKDKDSLKKILEWFKEIINNSFKSSIMKHYFKGKRKIRKGNYRIIFDISDNEIMILDIIHRKKDYK